tara:strand:+ start:1167 stop:1286 length:120 start_codon:yes stop_codon:yes gene_type:complete
VKETEVRYYPNKVKQFKKQKEALDNIVEQFKQLHKFLNK